MQARGPILSSLEATFGVSEAALGLVAPAGTVGLVSAVVAVELFAGRIRVRRALFLGTVLTGCALVAMAVVPRYAVETVPEYSGPLDALTTGATYAGIAIAPAVVGTLAEVYGIGRALWSTVGIALGLLATVATLWHWTGTADVPRAETAAD